MKGTMRKNISRVFGRGLCVLLACMVVFTASGCKTESKGMENIDYQPFVPPTLSPTKQPTPTEKPKEKNTPVPIPGMEVESSSGCTDNLVFIQDITIPDGTIVVAGSTLDKQWEVENTGTCDWGEGYTLRLYTGLSLNSDDQLQLIS